MGVVYSIPLTEDHIVETYAQHRTQQRAILWLAWPLKILCALGLLALLAVGIYAKIVFVIGFASFFLLLLAVGPRFDYWYMRYHWKRHPQKNELLRIEANSAGLSFVTSKSSATAQWDAYTKAVARPSGVLIYASGWEYYWLPDKAITEGSAGEMRDLLKSKWQGHHVV
jgi:hypothetical protein